MAKLLLVLFDGSESAQAAGFAHSLGLPFDTLRLTGAGGEDIGAEKLLDAALPDIPPADGLARGISAAGQAYSYIAAVSSMASKDVMARVAALMDAAMITDAMGIESDRVFRRPMVAGSIIATVEALAEPIVLTFRPAGFGKVGPKRSGQVEKIEMQIESRVRRLSSTSRGGSRPDLAQAKRIVTGGRPLKDAETFEKVIGGLADTLGGAVGATRAAVDSGIAPNELQVGQTGKIVAPDLYIAAGVSGSTQHMAGVKDSKIIVAVNKDPDAPIFESADLGLVADLFDALPEMNRQLSGTP